MHEVVFMYDILQPAASQTARPAHETLMVQWLAGPVKPDMGWRQMANVTVSLFFLTLPQGWHVYMWMRCELEIRLNITTVTVTSYFPPYSTSIKCAVSLVQPFLTIIRFERNIWHLTIIQLHISQCSWNTSHVSFTMLFLMLIYNKRMGKNCI